MSNSLRPNRILMEMLLQDYEEILKSFPETYPENHTTQYIIKVSGMTVESNNGVLGLTDDLFPQTFDLTETKSIIRKILNMRIPGERPSQVHAVPETARSWYQVSIYNLKQKIHACKQFEAASQSKGEN